MPTAAIRLPDDSSDDEPPVSLSDLLNSRYSQYENDSQQQQSGSATSLPLRSNQNQHQHQHQHQPSSPRNSFYRSLRQKASQLSLKSLTRFSSSSSQRPQRSNQFRDVERDGIDRPLSEPDPTLAPSERTRLFGPLSFNRSPFRSNNRNNHQPSYGALRLEDSDSEPDSETEESLLDALQHSDAPHLGRGLSSSLITFSNEDPSKALKRAKRKQKSDARKKWLGKRPLLRAGLQVAAIFVISTLLLGGTLWLALPRLEEQDRPKLRIPKSFEQLQDLNYLLKKYRSIYPYRIVVCFCSVYLFLQAFSLPGSMYLSILGGAVWGVTRALPLCCACVATGASLCYAISAAFGPALLTMPKWKARLDKWALKIESQRANLLSFLILIRIAPLPPHWVVNIVCPHLGIGILTFWFSTFLGMFGVTLIHTTIGGGLDEMTSAKDFHLFSWKNAMIFAVIALAVLIPVGLRWWFADKIAAVAAVEVEAEAEAEAEEGISAQDGSARINGGIAGRGGSGSGRGRSGSGGGLIFLDDDDDGEDADGDGSLTRTGTGTGTGRSAGISRNGAGAGSGAGLARPQVPPAQLQQLQHHHHHQRQGSYQGAYQGAFQGAFQDGDEGDEGDDDQELDMDVDADELPAPNLHSHSKRPDGKVDSRVRSFSNSSRTSQSVSASASQSQSGRRPISLTKLSSGS